MTETLPAVITEHFTTPQTQATFDYYKMT